MRAIVVGASMVAAAVVACADDPRAGGGVPLPPAHVDPSDAAASSPEAAAPEGGVADARAPSAYPFALPNGFPAPLVPPGNPLTREKAELGRRLFYDKRLSGNGTFACSSCHEQARAFTENRETSVGSTGQVHPRNSMTLANVAYAASMTWANPVLHTLEQQAPVPMFGIDPIVELGLRGKEDQVLATLRADATYAAAFPAAFPGGGDPFTIDNVVRALASFQRTLISGRSPFDRYRYDGDQGALTAQQKRGFELFESETLECFHCHGGFNFTDAVVSSVLPPGDLRFHNTGLYNVDGKGGFPLENRGLVDFTGVASDMGKFKAPTLRNIEKTAPYMHDGSIATLEEVVEHYAAGGRTIASGPHAGVGKNNPYKSGFIVSFDLSADDKAALVAFLRSLTDEAFLVDPALADPWPRADAGLEAGAVR